LQFALSASERKKSKSATKSSGSVIKAFKPAATQGAQLAPEGSSGALQAIELQRSSDPSEASLTDNAVVGRVILDQPGPAKQLVLHDVEAGHGLHKSGRGRGLALPFTPMAVAFKDVSYFVPHPSVSVIAGLGLLHRPWLHLGLDVEAQG
jgi:hypothetical protein